MDPIAENPKADIMCRCSGTTKTQIVRLVRRGITDLAEISKATGACSGCGACDTDILTFIKEETAHEP